LTRPAAPAEDARLSIHAAGILGLIVIFVVGTARPINLGVVSLAMTFLVGTFVVGEAPRAMYAGFPVDLFVLLAGVTYLFGIASRNGTVERVVDAAVRAARGRRRLVPWVVFVVAALPAMAGAIGSAGVALLAPLAMRLAERSDIDRRLMGLMVVHGAAAGNFSPLNVLGAIVHQAVTSRGLEMSMAVLFAGNLACNVALGAVIVALFGRRRRPGGAPAAALPEAPRPATGLPTARLTVDQFSTLVAIGAVAVVSLGLGLSIGFVALSAAVILHLLFPASSAGAERHIAWTVILLVCGVVTYVGALQRYGTVDAVGEAIAGLESPLTTALLIAAVAAVTSAFASSAGILGAMIPLAVPFMAQGQIGVTGMATAVAISATLVDATPFSTVGALVVANASEAERQEVFRGLLAWGAVMVVTAPVVTWLVFVLPGV